MRRSREALFKSAACVEPQRREETGSGHCRLAYTIAEAVRVSGIGRTKIYEAISDGRLDARKFGGRTLIPADALRGLLDGLPAAVKAPRAAARRGRTAAGFGRGGGAE